MIHLWLRHFYGDRSPMIVDLVVEREAWRLACYLEDDPDFTEW